jgi:hypothetical protein
MERLTERGGGIVQNIQEETNAWGNLTIATEGCHEPEKCFQCLLDYDCVEKVWEPAKNVGCKLHIPSNTGSPAPILSLGPRNTEEKLDVKDYTAGGKNHTSNTPETRLMPGLTK